MRERGSEAGKGSNRKRGGTRGQYERTVLSPTRVAGSGGSTYKGGEATAGRGGWDLYPPNSFFPLALVGAPGATGSDQ